MLTEGRRERGLSGGALKWIALVTMLIDHIGAVILEIGLLGGPGFEQLSAIVSTPKGARLYAFDLSLRFIGRLAFPIFCFLLVEGFTHTGNVRKYALRMAVFAVISEIPFDLAVFGTWFDSSHQNVFFTLLIGLLMMWGMERLLNGLWKNVPLLAAGCLAAWFLRTDYDILGILMIFVLYNFRYDKKRQAGYGALMGFLISVGLLGAAALAFIPIYFYNGQRRNTRFKYFFYAFYPGHLLILYLARTLLTG